VDVHGHIVAPPELYNYREFLIGTRGHYGRRLKGFGASEQRSIFSGRTGVLPPEDLKAFAEMHIAWLDQVGTDVQLISARPYCLMHSEKPERIVHWFAQAVNNAIAGQVQFYPNRLQGIANLPQAWGQPIETTFDELDRCMNDLGFVGVLVNPDPTEGRATAEIPNLGHEYWYPLYQKLVDYGAPMVVHSCGYVSTRGNQSLNFIVEESIAVMSLAESDVFETFPDLKVVIPHGGGAIPYQLGRFRGVYWQGLDSPLTFDEAIRQMYFDTSLYTNEALELLIKSFGADRVVFGTERPGDGSRTKTAGEEDDIGAILRNMPNLDQKDVDGILGDTALDIFPRLRAALQADKART
jgi:4-oxalmesaconate hydratase